MEFSQLLTKRRSIRRYEDKKVPLDVIKDIIKECTLAPNAGNEQPWKFIIINNREMMKKVSDESKKNILARVEQNPDDYAIKYEGILRNRDYNVFYDAPCLVLVLGDKNLKNLFVDCALASSYFMMAAANRGLGTCWVNLGSEIKDPAMMKELGIQDNHRIVAPLILGYAAHEPEIPRRKEPQIITIIS